MIINHADMFGVSQLYQLRGRIGRSSTQAYAYMLYSQQKLKPDAKKRLKAILEANELGSGFQISLKDLEIRGAGEILGTSQHGNIKTIGASHFLRLLQKTVKKLQDESMIDTDGKDIGDDAIIQIPISTFIPETYIPDHREKMHIYQKIAAIDSLNILDDIKEEIKEEYGKLPIEVENLFYVIYIKIMANRIKLDKVSISKNMYNQVILLELQDACSPKSILKAIEHNEKWEVFATKMELKLDKDTNIEDAKNILKKTIIKMESCS